MVRVLSLFWIFVLSIVVTAISFFYQQGDRHGFPFSYAKDAVTSDGTPYYDFNYWSAALDAVIWWILFSILWIIVKNYILEI